MKTESRQEKLEILCQFWKAHPDRGEKSGLSQREDYQHHNLIYNRFGY